MSAMDMNGAAALPDFIQRFRPPFPVGYNPHTEALTYMQTPLIAPGFVPKMAFIDQQGVIREQHSGEEAYFKMPAANIRKSLDELLKPAPASRKGAKGSRPRKK